MTCTRRTPPRIAASIAEAFGNMPSSKLPDFSSRLSPARSVNETSERGSSRRSRIPGAPVQRMSFSAPSAAPIAAATVSALMFRTTPASSAEDRADDRHEARIEFFADDGRIDGDDVAHEAVVHRFAVH
jgi:hypothetical protein